jgi:hypothetical protein
MIINSGQLRVNHAGAADQWRHIFPTKIAIKTKKIKKSAPQSVTNLDFYGFVSTIYYFPEFVYLDLNSRPSIYR